MSEHDSSGLHLPSPVMAGVASRWEELRDGARPRGAEGRSAWLRGGGAEGSLCRWRRPVGDARVGVAGDGVEEGDTSGYMWRLWRR